MGSRLINPYTLYILSFGGALLLYPIHWSNYYPALQVTLIIFLIASFLGAWITQKQFTKNAPERFPATLTRAHQIMMISILLYGLWIAEFIYAGGIPLYLILSGAKFDYRIFGIPTLHVFLVTFSSFYVAYLFYQYLLSRSPAILIYYFINMLPALLIFNRGMLLTNLLTSLFILLYFNGTSLQFPVIVRKLPRWAMIFILTCFLFGVLGTIRSSQGSKQIYDRTVPYEIGRASETFRDSLVPSEFFWFYLYLTSPLANLQYTIDQSQPEISLRNFAEWGINEILPDALSKRIDRYFGMTRKDNALVAHHLNASTVYSRSFAYLGWIGLVLMNLVILGLPFLYRKLIGVQSKYYLTAMAMLNTLYVLLIFDNMISFTGLSFQLAYPLIGSWAEKLMNIPTK